MIRTPIHRRTWSFLTVASVTLCCVMAGFDAIGQDAVRTQDDPVYKSWQKHPGVQACSKCHDESGDGFALLDTSFSRQDELRFWLARDKHAIARRRVEPLAMGDLEGEVEKLKTELKIDSIPRDWLGASNVLSRRICDKLGYDVDKTDGYNRFRDNCLSCHGGYRSANDDADFATGQPGISCNYCHQIDQNDAWVGEHGVPGAEDRWRPLPPESKAAKGMRDLVTVSTQASLCFDCHIGNRSEGKFVTHEMYAAGHPPIPSIELDTFCREMPQHWRSPAELYKSMKNDDKRDAYFQTNYPGVIGQTGPSDVYWRTRKMLLGALVARAKTLDLYIDSAQSHQWADYSLYDCAACHHELKSNSDRQLRGFPGAPGRPRQAEWPVVLFRRLAGDGAAFESLEHEFSRQLTEKPFGSPERVAPAARALRDRVEAVIRVVESKPIQASIAKRLLMKLVGTPKQELLTYDAARTIVWAIQTIVGELQEADAVDPRLAEVAILLGQSEITGIVSKLPSGRHQFIYDDALETDLERRADFDPARLVQQLDQMRQLLEASPPKS